MIKDVKLFITSGQPGLDGRDGTEGIKGQKGEMGLSYYGPKGDKGFPGMKGEPGRIVEQVWPNRTTTIVGPKGEQGSGGSPGDAGLQGYPGTKGEKGFPGWDGVDGIKGEKGLPGQPGPRVISFIYIFYKLSDICLLHFVPIIHFRGERVYLGHLDPLAKKVTLEEMDILDYQENQDKRVNQAPLANMVLLVSLDHLDFLEEDPEEILDLLDHKDQEDSLALLDLLVKMGLMAHKENRVFQVQLEELGFLDCQAKRDLLEKRVKRGMLGFQVFLELLDSGETGVVLVPLVFQVKKVKKENQLL